MDMSSILRQLKSERDRIDKAITAIEALDGAAPVRAASTPAAKPGRKRRHRMTPAGRRRLSQMMKQRWAERRKAKAAK